MNVTAAATKIYKGAQATGQPLKKYLRMNGLKDPLKEIAVKTGKPIEQVLREHGIPANLGEALYRIA